MSTSCLWSSRNMGWVILMYKPGSWAVCKRTQGQKSEGQPWGTCFPSNGFHTGDELAYVPNWVDEFPLCFLSAQFGEIPIRLRCGYAFTVSQLLIEAAVWDHPTSYQPWWMFKEDWSLIIKNAYQKSSCFLKVISKQTKKIHPVTHWIKCYP